MLVTLYSFAKERNSTAVPDSGVQKREFDCIIKDPFTLTNPTLIFKLDGIPSEMYCYIPDFGRFYFIESWTFSQNRWIATTSVDVLGSRRDGILATTQYVLRSASQFDRNIADSYYPAKSEYVYTVYPASADFWTTNPADVTFVLDISGSGNATYLYVFSYTQYLAFINYLLGNTSYLNLDQIADEISEQLSKMLFNPLDYIASCRLYPINYNTFISTVGGTAVKSIPFGWWNIPVSARRIGKSTYQKIMTFTYNAHPQAASRGSWLNLNPYTSITAFYPPFGTFDIPADAVYSGSGGKTSIRAVNNIDLISGNGALRVYNDVGTVVFHATSKIGVDMPLFAQAFDTSANPTTSAIISGANAIIGQKGGHEVAIGGDTAQSALNSVNSVFGTDLQLPSIRVPDVAGAVKDFVSGFLTASTKIDRLGSASSVADFMDSPCFVVVHTKLVDDDNSKNGRPLAKSVTLSTLGGYTTCQNPHVVLIGYTPTENDAVNAYLAAGFYIE